MSGSKQENGSASVVSREIDSKLESDEAPVQFDIDNSKVFGLKGDCVTTTAGQSNLASE
jgi:hypothetical protein